MEDKECKRDWKTRNVKGNGKQGFGEEMKGKVRRKHERERERERERESPGRGNVSVRAMSGREMHGGNEIRKKKQVKQ